MPTFGLDPDEQRETPEEREHLHNGWQRRDPSKKKQKHRSNTHGDCVWYFRSHLGQKMHHDFSNPQMKILQATVAKLVKGKGYTLEAMKDAIDRFYASGACQRTRTPCQLFASHRIQERIFRGSEGVAALGKSAPEHADAILTWIGNDFQRLQGADPLPWSQADDKHISLLLLSEDGMVALYTYPEVVASILAEGGDYPGHLYSLVDTIDWSQQGGTELAPNADYLRGIINNLPEEILKPGGARPMAITLADAIWRATK